MSYKELSNLIGDIYEAAYRPEHWETVLEKLVTMTESKASALMYQDLKIQRANGLFHYGYDSGCMQDYMDYYSAHDPFFTLSTRTAPLGTGVADYQMIPDRDELEQVCGEFFTGIMKPYDLHYIGGATIFNDGERIGAMTLNRGQNQGPLRQEHLDLLTELAPHIQRALRIHSEFVRLKSEERALRAGFDKLVMGLILFDQLAHPVYINPLAESILKHHPAIKMRNNLIAATNAEENTRLRQMIYSAVNDDHGGDGQHRSIGLHHPDSRTPLPVMVTPLQGSELLDKQNISHVTAAMYLSDPERSTPIDPETLCRTFDLTRKEASVAVALANGLSVEDVSETHGTTRNTIRTQLKAVFRKTGTRGQTELVRLLLSGPFMA